jgi:protocatechuate 3,4-dioxygenase beta subunit
MQDKRIPYIAGLLVLILAGLAAAFLLFNTRETETNTQRVAVDDSPFDKPRNDAGLPGLEGNRTGIVHPKDETGPEPEPEVQKPLVRVELQVGISGVATDYFDEPAGGITLTLLAEDGKDITGPMAVTDSEGRFKFELTLYEGLSYFVACLQEDKALTATEVFTVQQDKPVDGLTIKIYAPARATGVVINGSTREALEGVDILLEGRDERMTRLGKLLGRAQAIRSAADGSFAIERVAPGKYLVRASKQGWMANDFNPVTRAVQEMTLDEYANYELLPFILVQAGIVEGRVLRKSDKSPIPGASVELSTVLGGSLDSVVTDAEGKYRFENVPPGLGGDQGPGAGAGGMAVRATASGFAIATRDFRVRSGQTRSGLDLLLDDGCSVSGTVVDDKSSPVAGARVYYNDTQFLRGGEMVAGISLPERAVSTTTDAQGKFSLGSLPPGDVTITAAAEGFANKDGRLTLTIGTPAETTIVLEPAGAITGVVTNERGEPIEGVPIAVYDASGPNELSFIMKSFFGEALPDRGESTMFPASVRTDVEGRYRVDGLKAGEHVLIANSRDFEKHISPPLKVKAGEVAEYNIQLSVGGTIYGRVYDADNKPEAGVAVTCASILGTDSVRVRTAYTDRGGNYEISGLSAGTYTVIRNEGDITKLLLPNPANQVKVTAGERVQFDIYSQKPGTARLYGRVTLDGQPYADSELVLLGGNFTGFAANNTRTDKSGNYEFRSVPLGTYQIAQSGGRMPSLVRKRVRVDKEGDIEVNVDFVTVSISGRVELEGGGVPEGNIRVLASPVSPDGDDAGNDEENVNSLEMMVFREVQADKETGAFEITGLSPGFYRLTVRSEKNGMVTKPYLNLRASLKGVVMTLPLEGAALKGVVKGLDSAEKNTPFGLIAALTIEDEKGKPLALGGFDNGVNLTDSKEFTVKNLAEGTFTITLSVTGYTPVTHAGVKFTAGQTVTLEFVFVNSGNVKVKLLNNDIGIQSAFGLEYEIVNSKGVPFQKRFTFLDFFNADGSTSQNAEDNSFVIKDLPPETYTITLKLPGYKDASETFTVVAGETAEVSVQFEAE